MSSPNGPQFFHASDLRTMLGRKALPAYGGQFYLIANDEGTKIKPGRVTNYTDKPAGMRERIRAQSCGSGKRNPLLYWINQSLWIWEDDVEVRAHGGQLGDFSNPEGDLLEDLVQFTLVRQAGPYKVCAVQDNGGRYSVTPERVLHIEEMASAMLEAARDRMGIEVDPHRLAPIRRDGRMAILY